MEKQVSINEKTSSDCFDLQICPYSQEIADEMGLDCGKMCKNCRYCPVTCGSWDEVSTIPFQNDEDGGVYCWKFTPHTLGNYIDTIDNIQGMFWGYDEHNWHKLTPELFIERIRKTINLDKYGNVK